MTLKVQSRPCSTCIYRKDSALDIRQLEAEVADPKFKGYFTGSRICHHSKDVTCRGFWNRHKDSFTAGQVAQRLGLVEFVHVDTLSPRKAKPMTKPRIKTPAAPRPPSLEEARAIVEASGEFVHVGRLGDPDVRKAATFAMCRSAGMNPEGMSGDTEVWIMYSDDAAAALEAAITTARLPAPVPEPEPGPTAAAAQTGIPGMVPAGWESVTS